MSVYITGDTHRNFRRLYNIPFEENDTLIILGDAGINIFGDKADYDFKKAITSKIKCNIFCIHGNHEQRAYLLPQYQLVETNYGAKAWVDPEFPKLFFADDGEYYTIENHKYFVIGGAYSVDKYYRITNNLIWFDSEQPNETIKNKVEEKLKELNYEVDFVLSHTCPFNYRPTHLFLSCIDDNSVDTSTEKWLQKIEDNLKYNRWFFGHYHGDEMITDKIRLVYKCIYQVFSDFTCYSYED